MVLQPQFDAIGNSKNAVTDLESIEKNGTTAGPCRDR
jgi:hypothetical protein